jgi:hypothetical protein
MGAVPGATRATAGFGAEDRGRQVHCPEDQPSCTGIDALGGENAVDLGPVPLEVASGLGDTEAENEGAAAGAGHVMQAGAGIEVMAAAGAACDGGLETAAAVGQKVPAGANDQGLAMHRDLRGVKGSGYVQKWERGERKSAGRRYESNQTFPKLKSG